MRLRATASDLAGALTWAWSASKGTFIGGTDSARVRWRAPDEAGRFTIRVKVSDKFGDSASDRVTVEVLNDAPAFASSEFLFDLPENRDGSRQPVELGAVAAADPDGDELTYELAEGERSRFTVGAADGAVRYVGPGEDFESEPNGYELTVRARDPYGAAAEARVLVRVADVNDAPLAVGAIPDQSLDEGGDAATVDLAPFFADEDGDALAYRAESSDPGVATAAVSGSALTLTPVVFGTALVTVTAEDPDGLSATQVFQVGVSDRLVRGVVKETLAGLARSHLASARMTLGRRASAGGQEGSRLTVRGRTVPLGTADARAAAAQLLMGWMSRAGEYGTAGAVLPPGSERGGSWPGPVSGSGRRTGPMAPGGFAGGASDPWLRGTEFLLALGAGQDDEGDPPGRQWQVWGQGDLQAFEGGGSEVSDYDGELGSGYAGVDTGLTERWRAGVALSRSRGAGDWRVGGSRGSLETTLTAVHPYAQWSDGTTSVWATAGGGFGDAENERQNGAVGSSDLNLLLGLAEVRRRLAAVGGGFEFGVRADAGRAQLRTASGSETVAGHTAAVNQARVGLEVSHAIRPESGPSFFPFGEAHVRHDGGAGQTGTGLELVGGARVAHGRVRVDARGRLLVLHSATGYRERGVGVTLSVGDGGEEGLSLSLAPRWGNAEAAGTLWQEQLYRRYQPGPAGEEWTLDARGGYGMRLSSGRLLRWFGALGQSRHGFRFLVGGRVDVSGTTER